MLKIVEIAMFVPKKNPTNNQQSLEKQILEALSKKSSYYR